jgi:16S rRNA processing protein RimM
VSDRLIEVGKLGRPHGVRGELRLHLHNPDTDVFDHTSDVDLYLPGQPSRKLRVEHIRFVHGGAIVALEGVTDRDTAAALTHGLVRVAEADLPQPADDEVWLSDLVGADVIDADSREPLGRVRGLLQMGGRDLIDVALHGGGSALLPVDAPAIIELGRLRGQIAVRGLWYWRSE